MSGIGSVAIISTRDGASGSHTPSMSAKSPVCGTGGDHDDVGAERPLRRLDFHDASATLREPGHHRVLEDPAAVILKGPGVRLHRALRIGVAAEVQVGAPDRVVADDRHQLLELTAVEQLPPEAARLADLGPAPRERPLRLAEGDADPVRLILRRIAEQLVHLRPEPLFLEPEGAIDVRRAAAVAPGRLPAHDVLLEDEHVDAGAREPPSGAQPADAAAHDHDRRSTL